MTTSQTIPEICAALTQQGHPDLAQRIAYFASNEDLEEGDAPVTLESALGFWEFFSAVESDTRVELGCTEDGMICASWRFEDPRLTAIWFLGEDKVRFAAMYAKGQWVDSDSGGDACTLAELVPKLVEVGLFSWRPKHPVSRNLNPGTTLPDIAEAVS